MPELYLKPNHFAISVSNLSRSIKWYKEKLGFELEKIFKKEELNAEIAIVCAHGIRIEIFCFNNFKPLPEYRKSIESDLQVTGMKHFTFSTNDIFATINILKRRGVKFTHEPQLGASNKVYAFLTGCV